jgi:hypothetical protein
LPRWKVVRIKGSPAVEIGTVQAPDAATAIRIGIKEFEISDPEQRKRLAAYRVS